MFEKVLAAITNILPTIKTGSTGYLDEVPWIHTPVKGVDAEGRPFFALPLTTTKADRVGGKGEPEYFNERYGVVCFFKRYSDPTNQTWVSIGSHRTGEDANPCAEGALHDPANGKLEELLLKLVKGERVEFTWQNPKNPDKYGRSHRASRVLKPEEVLVVKDAGNKR